MNVPVARPAVAAFVAAVRAQLDDLSAEEVDELTEGLEADLNDALTEAGTSAEQFGDPAEYAAELRSAAGLPPRAVRGGDGPGVVTRARQRWDAQLEDLRAKPWWPGLRDFVVTLRPVWWVARAGVAASLLSAVLPDGWWLSFLLLAVASVELGRRGVAGRTKAARAFVITGNIIAAACLLPALAAGLPSGRSYDGSTVSSAPGDGVWVDGSPVSNIYPFDSQGRPLTGVQLYDQDGAPVAIGDSGRSGLAVGGPGETVEQVPAVDAAGQQRWNVYPLRRRTVTAAGYGPDGANAADVTGAPSAPAVPGISPGPLLVPTAEASSGPSPSPSPTSSPEPSAGRSPSASPSASPSMSLSPSPSMSLSPSPSPSPSPSSAQPSAG